MNKGLPIMPKQTYEAIFFDLDGTLLNLDMDYFLERYFSGVASFVARKGFDPDVFVKALGAGVQSMIKETGGYNIDRFWRTFCAITNHSREVVEPLITEYYETDFDCIGETIVACPEAAEVLTLLKHKKYPLYLTTMPLFPRIAVEKRLAWAGCSPDFFDRITTYDNSTSTKPHLEYYQENIDQIKVSPEKVLMVGNNTLEDLACMGLGIDAFLVTDCLLDPIDFDVQSVRHGSLKEFLTFAQNLPECE